MRTWSGRVNLARSWRWLIKVRNFYFIAPKKVQIIIEVKTWEVEDHTLRRFQSGWHFNFLVSVAAAILPQFLKINLLLKHFQAIFTLKFGISQPLCPTGWYFKWQNARFSVAEWRSRPIFGSNPSKLKWLWLRLLVNCEAENYEFVTTTKNCFLPWFKITEFTCSTLETTCSYSEPEQEPFYFWRVGARAAENWAAPQL